MKLTRRSWRPSKRMSAEAAELLRQSNEQLSWDFVWEEKNVPVGHHTTRRLTDREMHEFIRASCGAVYAATRSFHLYGMPDPRD